MWVYPYPYIIVSITFIGICYLGLKKLDRIIKLLEDKNG